MQAGFIPHLVVHDGAAAVKFYEQALGATTQSSVPMKGDTRLLHAAMAVDGATFFLCDDFPEFCGGKNRTPKALGGTAVTIHLCVPDCDAAIAKAAGAGATVTMPAMDAFWGDRYGKVVDPFGHEWSFSTPLSPERAAAAAEEAKKWM